MDWQSILTSGITTIIITIGWNYFSKRMDYQIEYKKYILRKRQEAYDPLIPIIHRLRTSFLYESKFVPSVFDWGSCFNANDELIHNTCLPIVEFAKQHHSVMQNHNWYSPELAKHMKRLNRLLNDIISELSPKTTMADFINLTRLRIEEIDGLSLKIEKQFFLDMCELSDIRKFIRTKKRKFIASSGTESTNKVL